MLNVQDPLLSIFFIHDLLSEFSLFFSIF